MHWDFALILLFLATAVPWLGRRRIRQLMQMPETTKQDRLLLYASTITFQWLAVAFVLWRTTARHVPPAMLGLSIPNGALVAFVSILLVALVFVNQMISLRQIARRPQLGQDILLQLARKVFPQDSGERAAFFAVVITVSLCEELVYRGFAQYVFRASFHGSAIAGIVGSAALFSIAHVYQGKRGVTTTFVAGFLFAIMRSWTGSLVPPVSAHFVADITAGMLIPGRLPPLPEADLGAKELS
jgi:uncharacterized protein